MIQDNQVAGVCACGAEIWIADKDWVDAKGNAVCPIGNDHRPMRQSRDIHHAQTKMIASYCAHLDRQIAIKSAELKARPPSGANAPGDRKPRRTLIPMRACVYALGRARLGTIA